MSSGKRGWLSIFRRPEDAAKYDGPGAAATSAAKLPARSIAPPPLHSIPPPAALPAASADTGPARLVLGIDATSSRAAAWKASQRVMGALFTALPGELDVALAVHGGGRVHTFTPFVPDADELRPLAAGIRCQAGYTRLLDILREVLKRDRVRVVVYIGDVFEESRSKALRLADELRRNETRVIILHDAGSRDSDDGEIFRAIAARTGGAVLPFDACALDELGEMLKAVSVLAVGGTGLLETKQETMPAAAPLLERLADSRQLLIGSAQR